MGVLDKFLDVIKLNDDYDDDEFLDDDLLDYDEDEDDFLDDDMEDKPKKKFFEKFSKKAGKEIEDDFDDTELDVEPIKASAKTSAPKTAPKASQTVKAPAKQERSVRPAASSKITPMRSSKKSSQAPNMEVCVIRPTSMEDTREIADRP